MKNREDEPGRRGRGGGRKKRGGRARKKREGKS
jgi:hypothetical protein